MKEPSWRHVAKASADPARATRGFEALLSVDRVPDLATCSEQHLKVFATIFAASEALTTLLLRHPEWTHAMLAPESLKFPRREQGLRQEVNSWLQPALTARDFAGAFSRLRQFKQREMLRIGARDLVR